eukprot:335899-Chlamydomonas_euryale.AAC.1
MHVGSAELFLGGGAGGRRRVSAAQRVSTTAATLPFHRPTPGARSRDWCLLSRALGGASFNAEGMALGAGGGVGNGQ